MQESEEYQYVEHAAFWLRFGAYMADLAIVYIFSYLVASILPLKDPDSSLYQFFKVTNTYTKSVITTYAPNNKTSVQTKEETDFDAPDSTSLFMLLYGLTELFTSASLGKRVMQIKIKSMKDFGAPSFGQSLIRWLFKYSYFLFSFLAIITGFWLFPILKLCAGLFLFFGAIFIITEYKRSFHDMMSKTSVFKT